MLPLLLALFLIPQDNPAQDKPPEKCTLSGLVTDSATGATLNKVEIFVESLQNPREPVATANADAKGNFSLAGLNPGKYRVKGVRNGYLDTYYGMRRGDSHGTTVTLDAGQDLTGLQLKLIPYAVIAGTIRDADGEPVAGVNVTVRRLVFQNGRRRLDDGSDIPTDDLGQYRAANLLPGKYYVEAWPRQVFAAATTLVDQSAKSSPPREVLQPAFYPGVRDAAAASPIEVAPGARVTGIDIPLARSRVYHVSGRVAIPSGASTNVILEPVDPWFSEPIAGSSVTKNGEFDISDVPPGSYIVNTAIHIGDGVWSSETPITVSGADVSGLRLTPEACAEVSGKIAIEGGKQLSVGSAGPFVRFTEERSAHSEDFMLDSDDTISAFLSHGRYAVSIFSLDRELVVKSIGTEQADILRDGLTLAAGAKVSIEIVVAPDGGQIDGSALDKDDNPLAGATVVAIPEPALRAHPERFYQASTDQNGRFQLNNVAPGEYKIFAWDDIESGVWFDPDFLRDVESRGEPVKLGAKGRETVKVHVLGAQ